MINKNDLYQLTFEIECLHSFGTAISNAFHRYIKDNEDKQEDMGKASSEAWQLAYKLYACQTKQQISEIENKLLILKKYLLEIVPDAIF